MCLPIQGGCPLFKNHSKKPLPLADRRRYSWVTTSGECQMDAKVPIGYSACPHDCPSTCALEVELLGNGRIGRVHGAKSNSYTAGVVCTKVARYAERVHHP